MTATFQKTWTLSRLLWVGAAVLLAFHVPTAEAQTTVGGHIGFVLPLVTRAAGQTTNISDNFSIGFPLGVTFKGKGRMAYDLELVPGVQDSPRNTSFTVHPGLVWGVGHNFGEAFSKAQLSAGTPLPEKGTVFISVNDRYKAEVVPIGKRFAELGFDLVATRGTAASQPGTDE